MAILKAGFAPANAAYTDSVGWVVVSCTPRKVDLMCISRPIMVNALMCSSLIQLMDSDLSTNADECSSDNNNGYNALSHGLYGINATGLWQY